MLRSIEVRMPMVVSVSSTAHTRIRCNMNCLWCLIVSVALLVRCWQVHRFKRRFAHIPQLAGWPLFGNALSFVRRPFAKQTSLQDRFKHQNLALIWICNNAKVLLLNTEYIKQLLKNKHFLNKPWQYRFLSDWLGQGLLVASGCRWKQSRRVLNHVFSAQLLDQFCLVFNREGRCLASNLDKGQDAKGRIDDIYPLVERITLSAICETAMGTRLLNKPQQTEQYLNAVKLVSSCAMLRSNSIIYQWHLFFRMSPMYRRYKQALKVLHEFSWNIIWTRLNDMRSQRASAASGHHRVKVDQEPNPHKTHPLLDTLLNMYLDHSAGQCPINGMAGQTDPTHPTHQINQDHLSLIQIREEVDTFVFAGFDTTACALSWSIYLLALHPHQQTAVRQELHSAIAKIINQDKSIIDHEQNINFNKSVLNELRLLEACIKESLRLFSPVPIILRDIGQQCPLTCSSATSGHKQTTFIPAPASCAILIQHHHLNEQIHKNAHNFEPGRFLSADQSVHEPFHFIPFSEGHRKCIGQHFAMLELKIILAQLLLKYELSTDLPLEQVQSSFELVQKPCHKLPIFIRPIKSNNQTTIDTYQ